MRKTPSKTSTASAGAVVTGGDSAVPCAVVDRVLEPSVSARAERIEQNPVQRVVVVGVEVAAFGRVLAAPIALCPGEEEVVDRRADDVAALRAQDDGQLVGQRGLAGGGRSVDGDPRRVCDRDGPDRLGQAAEQLVAGAFVHVLPRPALAEVAVSSRPYGPALISENRHEGVLPLRPAR